MLQCLALGSDLYDFCNCIMSPNSPLPSVVNSANFKSSSASSLVASPSPQNFKVTSPSPHATSPSPLLSTQDRVVTNMIADYSTFTNL